MNFGCPGCGADLAYAPGTERLTCPYCGREVNIAAHSIAVEERDFQEFIQNAIQERELQEIIAIQCSGCGAETTLPPNVTSDACPFCRTNLIASHSQIKKLIKPEGILPFAVNHDQVKGCIGTLD